MAITSSLITWVALLALGADATDSCYQGFQCPGGDLANCPRVVTPTDVDYDESREQFASLMSSSSVSDERLHPEMIFFCSEAEHVLQAIDFAKECDYKISVRSGGHNYAGFSSCVDGRRCIQLDLSGLSSFEHGVDGVSNRVTLGVGLRLENITQNLLPLGLFLPHGVCKTVGTGGHFQSSSKGFMARSFGLGMDYIRSFELATADGSIITVDPSTGDGELYWAVLGGSPGSWGVVLSYTFDAIRAADYPDTQIGLYVLPWAHSIFVEVMNNLVTVHSNETNARDFYGVVTVTPLLSAVPDNVTGLIPHVIVVQAVWTGIDNGPWTDAFSEAFLKPLINPLPGVEAQSYVAMQSMPMNVALNLDNVLTSDFNTREYRYHIHYMSTNKWFDESFVEALASELDERTKIPLVHSSLQVWTPGAEGAYGSQMMRNSGKNAYPHRDTKMFVDDWFMFKESADADMVQDRIANFRELTQSHWTRSDNSAERSWMTPHTTDSVDDLTGPAEDTLLHYFPSEDWFQRLQAAKDAVDPTDVFSSLATIPATASMTTSDSESSSLLSPARRHSYDPSV